MGIGTADPFNSGGGGGGGGWIAIGTGGGGGGGDGTLDPEKIYLYIFEQWQNVNFYYS